MRETPSKQASDRRPGLAGLVIGVGMFLVALFGYIFLTGTAGPPGKNWPVWLVALAVYVAGFFWLKAVCHPLRDRSDQTACWRQRYPEHSEEELQRFLQVVGDELGLKAGRAAALHPDDRPEALTQEAFCGDGLDLVELVMALEDEYAVELPDRVLETSQTLGDLFEYLTRPPSGGAQASAPPSAGAHERPAGGS